ncbi:hypothetical protein Asp14428_70350 [Actinoplanes sp. NBRC 14428]|uniref:Fibronectin type-III domain-containing protein n=1 Tax=Pseudosporangium ferrugineum TaxID=439699 RepID=A0A2T0S2N6_9ACTN|nr:hypothetical protein [Pseudosporangium ferrugineum]PRY27670.1 hypothetical protein CLV70_110257 [Pseudosporangium ferrugineum]BCJ55560.1 hypothetical protein Asp14428_70350 [Actinoplanes sp. NBRC 14428]
MKHRRRWLLVLAPLLLTGCGGLGGSATTGASPSSGAAGAGAGGGNSWLVVERGSPTPSPTPSSGIPPYPTPAATGFLPLKTPQPTTPTPTCAPDTVHFSRVGALAVTPGTTSATASWYNVGGYNLVEYRLTAISHDLKVGNQRDIGWIRIKPRTACGPMTATIRNLDRKTGYVFSLDAVVTRRSGDGTHAGTLLRSHVIYTR